MLEILTVFSNPTSSSAITEGPRDALSQLKSRQLLHNCTKNHICPFMWYKNIARRFFGLVTKHACDRRTKRWTDRRTDRITTPKTALS